MATLRLFSVAVLAMILLSTLSWTADALKSEADNGILKNRVLQQASQNKKIKNMGFSGSGFYLPYHLGVLYALKSKNVINGQTNMAGSSGGGIASLMFCAGLFDNKNKGLNVPFDLIREEYRAYFLESLPEGAGLSALTKTIFGNLLPNNAHKRCSKGRTFVHMTKLNDDAKITDEDPQCIGQIAGNLTASNFKSRKELYQVITGTSFVANLGKPGKCGTKWRNHLVYDGGYSVELPCPPKAKNCVRVVVIPKERWEDWTEIGGVPVEEAEIYPGIRPNATYVVPVENAVEMMFDPELIKRAIDLFDAGRMDALYWIENYMQA